MNGWLVLAGYVVGWFVAVPAAWRVLAKDFVDDSSTPLDIWVCALLATICACLWPLLLLAAFVRRMARAGTK